MERTICSSLVLVSCLYLSLVATPTSGKCHGRWAIHGCYGGNGKRSDPSMDLSSPDQAGESAIELSQPSLLHKVLLTQINSDKSWPESIQDYLSRDYLRSLADRGSLSSLSADETEEEDNSCSARLDLALAEVAELRKYASALERLLRARNTDLA